jgi:hypothetical protein
MAISESIDPTTKIKEMKIRIPHAIILNGWFSTISFSHSKNNKNSIDQQ